MDLAGITFVRNSVREAIGCATLSCQNEATNNIKFTTTTGKGLGMRLDPHTNLLTYQCYAPLSPYKADHGDYIWV